MSDKLKVAVVVVVILIALVVVIASVAKGCGKAKVAPDTKGTPGDRTTNDATQTPGQMKEAGPGIQKGVER